MLIHFNRKAVAAAVAETINSLSFKLFFVELGSAIFRCLARKKSSQHDCKAYFRTDNPLQIDQIFAFYWALLYSKYEKISSTITMHFKVKLKFFFVRNEKKNRLLPI